MTNLVTDEMLMALADGEIDRETAAALMRQVDADPELKRRLAAFRDTRRLSKAAFAAALEEPIPSRLVQAVGASPARPRRQDWIRFWLPIGAAVAASIVGLVVGLSIPARVSPEPHAIGPEIAEVLDNGQSGEARSLADGGRVVVTGTYLTPEGACRSFEMTPGGAGMPVWHDVACHRTGGWELEMAVAGHPGGDTFVPASDRIAASLADLLDSLGAGEALDATAELRLRERGWQNNGAKAE